MNVRLTSLLASSALAIALGFAGTASAGPPGSAQQSTTPPTRSITTWSASDDKAGGSLANITIRNLLHTTAAGTNPQIRISNFYGTDPITFSSVYVGVPKHMSSPDLVPGSNRQVTFNDGSASVTVPAGGVVLSDPLPGRLAPESNLAVSVALEGSTQVITAHNRSMQYTFKSDTGDWAADESGNHFGTQSSAWYFVDAIVVQAPKHSTTISALGDSITDGVGSTMNANHRWTDYLAHRLDSQHGHAVTAVANEGISGNRVASGGGQAGAPGATRLTRDLMTKPGVGSVFLFEGINDIGGGIEAANLIAADKQIAEQVHAQGKCIFAATITPASPVVAGTKEQVRQQVNQFLRHSPDFDAVFDFSKVVEGPQDPSRLAPRFDSGDHIHLSDAGYQAVANSIDLKELECK